MTDSTDPTPTPTPPTVLTERGLVNKIYSEGLEKTATIIHATRDPLYADAMINGDILPAFVNTLADDNVQARIFLANAISKRGARQGATIQESIERQTLTRMLQTVQTRSLQKYHDIDPHRPRDTYYVGTRLNNVSDATLIQIATGIIDAAPGDSLPGLMPPFLTDLTMAFIAWQTSIDTQAAQGGSAIQSLAQFEAIFKSIETRRRTIQFAADAAFPYYDPLQKVAREAFCLPTKTPFRGS